MEKAVSGAGERIEEGPYAVEVVHDNLVIDDDVVSLKIYRPAPYGIDQRGGTREGKGEGTHRFPAILEYLPYRKSDRTAPRDSKRHRWMASHGYLIVRVDIRGTGDSEGLMLDEYAPTELEDGVAIIEYISKLPNCTGAVGLYGKSWGGFNGLQIAALQPPQLKGVISLYSTGWIFYPYLYHIFSYTTPPHPSLSSHILHPLSIFAFSHLFMCLLCYC